MGQDPPHGTAPPSLVLDPLAQAVSAARRYVRGALPALGGESMTDNAQLAVSELVTNATLHARTEMTVEVLRTPAGRIRINVADQSAMIPQPRVYALTATTGRGLRLLEAITTAWGVIGLPGGAGKIVWAEPAPDSDGPAPDTDWGAVIADLS
ncbi:MAG: ATP-binding region ATPase domain protein [Frankiales bacterium]|nr:ATP-binding region ATPase domain protein [Frankiales bacterium]